MMVAALLFFRFQSAAFKERIQKEIADLRRAKTIPTEVLYLPHELYIGIPQVHSSVATICHYKQRDLKHVENVFSLYDLFLIHTARYRMAFLLTYCKCTPLAIGDAI